MTSVNISAQVQTPSVVQDAHKENLYLGFHGGQSGNILQQVENLESYGSYGVSAGSHFQSGIILESSLFFTPHIINPRHPVNFRDTNHQNHLDKDYYTNVDQWTGTLAVKYTPFSSRLKPYLV